LISLKVNLLSGQKLLSAEEHSYIDVIDYTII